MSAPRLLTKLAFFALVSILMGELGIKGKLVADQCGHTLDVSPERVSAISGGEQITGGQSA
jgi:hypothetical protein